MFHADDMKLWEVTDTPEGCAAIEQDLGWQSWAERNLMSFNMGSVGSSTWGGITPNTNTCWGLTSHRAALQRRIW